MKSLLSALVVAVLSGWCRGANDNVLIIGDSLSKEYRYEGAGIGIETFPPPSPYPLNWCELLDDRRRPYFDFGDADAHSDIRLLGHDYNWSVPGSYAREWHDAYLNDPPSSLVSQLGQPQVKRIVIWLGGNDVRDKYGALYNGDLALSTWADQTYGDLSFVLEWVLARRLPSSQVVLVNVAHLGGTIAKNRDFPYDPVKTGRVTAAIEDVNTRLAALALARGLGLADIYRMTKELVTADQVSIGGWMVKKKASEDGDADAMFLGDGFHPNMPVQALFGQIIVDTFNDRFGSMIPRLTNREIVDKCLEENADISYSQWTASYGLPAASQGALSDPDGDGIPNIVEFGLDLDPSRPDANLMPRPRLIDTGGQLSAALMWQPRDTTNTKRCEITAQYSTDLVTWVDVPASGVVSGSPNTRTASVPLTPGQSVWMRLKARQLAP